MLTFQGYGDLSQVAVRIFGDGRTTDINIDLSKAPFNLVWGTGSKSFYPKGIIISEISGYTGEKSITMLGDLLYISFNEPPPATNFENPEQGIPQPRVSFTVQFIYGSEITRGSS